MAGWHDFLRQTQKKLHRLSNSRAVLLYLEAVLWLDGMQGLAEEVRQRNFPVGYLYWLDQLRDSEAWDELAQAAQEALNAMPFDRFRAIAAAQLSLAGEKKGDSRLAVQGKREQFFSEPHEKHLADLLREAAKQQVIEAELAKVLAFLEAVPAKNKPDVFFLRMKTMLLLGQLRESYAAIDQKAAIGWSGDKKTTGAVYVAILLILSQGNAEAKTVHALFDRYMCGRDGSSFLANEIQKRLLQLSVSEAEQQRWFQFVERISVDRAEHIISNKYRKGYARAAEALGGFMECLILHEQQSKAAEFLNVKRNKEYKRYPAFRQEFDEMVRNSPLLSGVRL